jgi:hypothetical protein
MPPQQAYDLLDFGDDLFDFGAHSIPHSMAAPDVVDPAPPINPPACRAA